MSGPGGKRRPGDQAKPSDQGQAAQGQALAAKRRKQLELKKKQDAEQAKSKKEQQERKEAQSVKKKPSEKSSAIKERPEGQGGAKGSIEKPDLAKRRRKDLELQASRGAVEPYDMATGPKRPDNLDKSVPQGKIEVKKMTPPKKALELRPHVPKDIPEAPTKAKPKKSVEGLKPDEGLDPRYEWEFPPEKISRSDQKLSPKEIAERKKIFQPKDGVGCPFGEGKSAPGEIDRWWNERTDKEKAAIKDPDNVIYLTGFSSPPGTRKYNRDLAKKRCEYVAKQLGEKFGVDRSRIVIEPVGEDLTGSGPGDNRDNSQDRVVMIDIVAEGKREKKKDIGKAKSPEKKLHGLNELPDDYKDKASLQDGAHPRDQSFMKEGRLFLPNAETGGVRWISINDLPEGYSQLNNHWVYRDGNKIETQHRYLEKEDAIRTEWRRRTKAPLLDSFGNRVEMDKQQLRRHVEVNKLLNRWMESYLKGGDSLEVAREKTRKRSLNVLKTTIAPLIGIGI